MDEFKFNTIEDLQKTVDNFYKIPIRSRIVIANKIHRRLRELNGFVKVFKENPILNYPCERFIVNEDKGSNEYSKFAYLLDEDVESFNWEVYNDIDLSTDNLTGVFDVVRLSREQNNKADDIYLQKFPSHKDLIGIFKMAVSKIELCLINDTSESIAMTSIDDIEFIISTNILTDSHVQRLLLGPMVLLDMPVFRRRFERYSELKRRLSALFHTQIKLVKKRRDEFMILRPFNDEALKAYLKIQKMGYEEILINSEFNGDYSIEDKFFKVHVGKATLIDDYVRVDYPHLKLINMIDKFKLEQHGLKPIVTGTYNGVEYYAHKKNGVQYNLYQNPNKKDLYFMIGQLDDGKIKSYKININDNTGYMDKITSNAILESTFITHPKMDR